MASLLRSPDVALTGRAPFHRWLQIAFPVRQRTQFIYGCYLGEIAMQVKPDKRLGAQIILVGRDTVVGVPGKQITVEAGWGYGFDPRCMLIDNATGKIRWHPWMLPIEQHTEETRAWMLAHPEWIPKGYRESRQRIAGPLKIDQFVYITDEPTVQGDRQAITQMVPGFWGYKREQHINMKIVLDLEDMPTWGGL